MEGLVPVSLVMNDSAKDGNQYIYSTCKLFGLLLGDFLNNKVLVGDERLFTVTVTEKEHMYVQLARELIRLRDGYL